MAYLLCGDDTGLVKRVKLRDGSSVKFGSQVANRSVHKLAWAGVDSGDNESWESAEKDVAVGLRNGVVELWNAATREITASFDALSITPAMAASIAASAKPIDASVRAPLTMNAGSKLVGMAVLQSGLGATDGTGFERRLLTCSSSGVVHIRPFSTLRADGSNDEDHMEDVAAPVAAAAVAPRKGKKGSAAAAAHAVVPSAALPSNGSSSFAVGSDICVLKVERAGQAIFAAGGKEHMLKLWDIATASVSFKEKNVPHDMLNLRQQVWITDLAFVPNTGGAELVTGTAWHQVRHYDTRAQKRPIFNVEVGDHAVTCVDVSHDGRFLVVGDGSGRLQQLDLRKNARMVHVYHGMGGSVRGIQAHATMPILSACGLDRFLRVYDVNTRKQLHKVYLKQKLNCVLFSAQTPEQEKEQEEAAADAAAALITPKDEEDDELWHELNQRAKRQASDTTESGNGTGAYVKKRKLAADEDDEVMEEAAPTPKKPKTIQIKQEPVDTASTVAASASSSFKPVIKAKPAAKASTLQSSTNKAGQIVFRQAVAFDEDDEEEDDEDAEGEDGEEDGEDEEMADGEDDEEEDAEEEEDVVPEPAPVATPARKTRASRAPASTTRETRSASKRK